MNAPFIESAVKRTPSAEFIAALQERFGKRCSTAQAVRDHHGSDESPFPVMAPDDVLFADSTEEVPWLAGRCPPEPVPLIPCGGGSSLQGHLLAWHVGFSYD